jgi:hypothetical protein
LQLDPQIVHSVSTLAARSPVPITVFDGIIEMVLDKLYTEQFHQFAKKYNMLPAHLSDSEATQKIQLSVDWTSDMSGEMEYNTTLNSNTNGMLRHTTSSILDFIRGTADSIYSEIDQESDFNSQRNSIQNDITFAAGDRESIVSECVSTSSMCSTSTKGNHAKPTERINSYGKDSFASSHTTAIHASGENTWKDACEEILALYEPTVIPIQVSKEKAPNWKRSIKKSMQKIFKVE